ncbi:hypothetical protein C0J50_2497, partial [Silurus asotus]
SFPSLSLEYGLPTANFFRYLQVLSFESKCLPNFPSVLPKQPWESLVMFTPHQRRFISRIYSFILSLNSCNTDKTRTTWEKELGLQFGDKRWEKAVDRIQSTTSCAHLSLILFKVLYRIHLSKSKQAKIYPRVEDRCDRC